MVIVISFKSLTSKQKEVTLQKVNKLFDRHFWHEFKKFQYIEFEKKFPNDYRNSSVDKLQGDAKKLYEKQNKAELEAISPIFDKILQRETNKRYIKDYESKNKQRRKLRGWLKKWSKVK